MNTTAHSAKLLTVCLPVDLMLTSTMMCCR